MLCLGVPLLCRLDQPGRVEQDQRCDGGQIVQRGDVAALSVAVGVQVGDESGRLHAAHRPLRLRVELADLVHLVPEKL